jgi:hypothetical protein
MRFELVISRRFSPTFLPVCRCLPLASIVIIVLEVTDTFCHELWACLEQVCWQTRGYFAGYGGLKKA